MGASNVFQVCGDLGIMRVAFASSEQALGYSGTDRIPAKLPLTEEDELPALHAYALSKQIGERIAEAMTLTYPGMSIVSLRINYVALESEYEHFRGRQGAIHRPYNFWGYVDSRDAARAFRLAIERSEIGHVALNISAKDHSLAIPTRVAMAEIGCFPDFPENFPEFGGPMDCTLAKEALNWEAEHSWRDSN
jgi:nucleoside-diphosphate-sugar epimerase